MYKNMVYLLILLVVTLGCKNGDIAPDIKDQEMAGPKPEYVSANVNTQASTIMQIFSADDKSNQSPQNKEYEELKEELKGLMEEMKKLEKETKNKVKKEILPLIRREIEKIRKWLKKFHPEDDESEPIQIHMENP